MNPYELNLRKSFLELSCECKHFFKPRARTFNVKDRHDLRVLIRKMEAILKLLKDYLPESHYKNIRKVLKRTMKKLGRYRDKDVLHENAKELNLKISVNFKKNIPLKNFISNEEIKILEKELSWIHKRLEEMTEIPLKRRTEELQDKLINWQKQKSIADNKLHAFRIFMKRVRYSLEAYSLPVEDLKTLQNHLGRFHDMHVLQDYVSAPEIARIMQAEQTQIMKGKKAVMNSALAQLRKVSKSL